MPDADPGDGDDRIVQYVWGHTYIDDILMRRETTTVSSPDPSSDYTTERYYCTDEQYSPVAILDGSAKVIERITYDAYGRARHMPGADVDGSGQTGLGDLLAVQGNWGNFGEGDINRDGTAALADQNRVLSEWGQGALDDGELSFATEDNIIGFSGYLFNKETRHYHVRFRVYDTGLGRWLETDPLRYVDGMNLYQYVGGMPLRHTDPTGEIIPLIIIGAAAGGLFGGISAGIATDWDPWAVAAGTGIGALSGAFGGAVFGLGASALGGTLGTLGTVVASGAISGAAANVLEEILWAWYNGMPLTAEQIARAAAEGFALGGIMGGVLHLPGTGFGINMRGMRRPPAAVKVPTPGSAVHGNSYASTRTTYLYGLYHMDGTFLKWGITQDMGGRYTNMFLRDKYLIEFARGSRRDMAIAERWLYRHNAGPLNHERSACNVLD